MNRSLSTSMMRTPASMLRDVLTVGLVVLLALFATATTARADVPLSTAESFAVLAGQSVTNTGLTTITGDIGISPGAAASDNLTDNGTITHDGALYDAEAVALKAQEDLVTAYDDAAGRTPDLIDAELAGADLVPGVYTSTDPFLLSVDGTLTLRGDADDVWVFQSGSTLTFMSGSTVVFAGDADPCNVFWQVTSSATLGTGASVIGTIMALTSISLETGAELEGRALARNGSVTLDANTITASICATPVVEPEPEQESAQTTPPADDTPAQVEEVPSGPVAAGGRTISTTGGLFLPLVGGLALLILAGVLVASIRGRGRI